MSTCPSSTAAIGGISAHPPAASLRRDLWPLVTVAFGFIMAMLDVTVVNVALDSIRSDLSMRLAGLVWVVDAYTLSFAALLMAGGALADRHGARKVYAVGLGAFVAASVLCASAPQGWMLIGARLLQGAAAALFIPSSLGLLSYAYPDEKVRGRMLGLWAAIVSLSAAAGPLVGGVVVTYLGWRSIFWLNVPIGLIGVWMVGRHLPAAPGRDRPLALGSHAQGALALAGLAFALIQGPAQGWASAAVLSALAVFAVAGARFVRAERRSPTPTLPHALVRNGRFLQLNGVGFLINFGVFGMLFLVSLHAQQVRHASPLATGLGLLPLMFMFTAGNLLAARIVPRAGHDAPMRLGLALAATSTVALCALAASSAELPPLVFDALVALDNLGAGLAVPAMATALLGVGAGPHANTAAAALNANRQLGALVGVAAVGMALHGPRGWSAGLPLSLGLLAAAFLGAAALSLRKAS